ncbi:MAG: adenylate/guanylate cyclase domain-containing protein [Reyranella sp.]|nr:adenylate/guanylate cyclase domain-containing protein [Reyranella sp.]
MEAPRLERKLVAILAADVEGYSRHMERDEAATLATLSSHRLIFDELIAAHNGRITGTAGDSVLAEFASVVDALDCALKVQDRLVAANAAVDAEHRLWFRIGLNVGDVMVKDGDIFGDGVNIAARLESLATPGGVCISRGVRDHVRKMGRYAFEDLGEQGVKNIAQPIRAFRVRLSDAPAPAEDEQPIDLAPHDQPAAPTTAAPPAAEDSPEFELAFWEAMKDSRDPAEFTAYLEKYPQGAFTALAEARLKALQEEAAAPSEPQADAVELAYWDTVKDSDNPEMFRAYLKQYPEGAFAPLAKVRLDELDASAA